MEFIEWTLNNRPIGLQSDLEVLTPNSFKPIHSHSDPPKPFENYSTELTSAKEKFSEDWSELYYKTILRQTKWIDTTAEFAAGDNVLISDLKGQLGYPVLGRVRSLEQDSDGVNRYFVI